MLAPTKGILFRCQERRRSDTGTALLLGYSLAVLHLSPIFVQGSPVEAHHRAHKNEEGRELDEHGPGLDQASMPQDCWDSEAAHGRRSGQKLCSIDPPEKRDALPDYNYYVYLLILYATPICMLHFTTWKERTASNL